MRLFVTAAATLFCAGSLQAQAPSKTDCPPPLTAPSAEQVQAARAAAVDRGALWKLSKDGRHSYLYGTVHVGRLEWLFPGPKLTQALRETALLAVELDITDPALAPEMQRLQDAATPLKLEPAEQARLDAQADAACLPREALAKMHPIMQAISYVALSARREGMEPAFGQEIGLISGFKMAKRPVIALETPATQLGALLPTDAAQARRLLHSTLEGLEKRQAGPSLSRVAEAWVKGDLATLGSPALLCQCTPSDDDLKLQRRLNDERNPALAARIAEEHAKGQPLLAAVGLLHMTGEQALPKLLAAQGFTVERVH